jgi:hypothetical protein
MIRRVAFALILGAVVAPGIEAQVPSTATPTTAPTPPPMALAATSTPSQPKPALSDVPPPPTPAALPARAVDPADAPRPANPPQGPARNQAARAANAGNGRDPLAAQGRFANPGGVGRHAEYYTPFTPMTGYQGSPYNRSATFGRGGGPTRGDQVQAFQVGQYRTQNIQNNLNAYGQPFGYGIGIGLGFGRGFGGFR